MTTRQSALFAIFVGGLVLAVLGGCSAGNPNVSAAEDALEQSNYQEALSSIETALEEDSANVEAYQLKAQILRQMADSTMPPSEYKKLYERAREAEEKAIKFDPSVRSDIETQRRLAYVQQFQRGADNFNRAQQQGGDSTSFAKAAAFFGAAGAIFPDSASAHLNEAYSRLRMNQRQEAIPVLERYVETADTVRENAYNLLARLYLTNNRTEDAISLLEKGTDQYPENSELQSLLLKAYNQSGNTDKAMAAYRKQIKENPKEPTYRYNYGSLLLQAERYDEAIKQLEKAVELDPQNVKAQYNLGAAYMNKALAIDDSIAAIEDTLRSGDQQLSQEQKQRVQKLVNQRQKLFKASIPPLERARQLSGEGDNFRQDACTALFTAYVQTEQQDKAAKVEKCAGYEEGRAEKAVNGDEGGGGGN